MFYVYILYSHKDNNLYVGQTNDLEGRIRRHKNGHVSATEYRLPITCIYSENYDTRNEAMQRERFLKGLWSGRFKRKLKEEFESSLDNE